MANKRIHALTNTANAFQPGDYIALDNSAYTEAKRLEASVLQTAIDLDGLTPTDGNFIVGDGSAWVAESGATALASIGAAAASHTHGAGDIASGTLVHERGGLEADVSAYAGLVKISGGSTSAVTVTAFGESLIDDSDAATARTTLGLGTMATEAATGFLATTGVTTGATSQAQAFTSGVVTGVIKPASNSTTAVQFQNASGTMLLNLDTTNMCVGIGTVPSSAALHVVGTNGMLRLADVSTASTAKYARIAIDHYSAATPVAILYGYSTAGNSVLNFGGGTGAMYAARQVSFYAGATTTTATGTEMMRVTSSQVTINTTTTIDQASATGAVPVLLLDQADDSEEMIEFTGTVGTGNAIEAVGAKSLTTTHFIKCTITGVGNVYIPVGTIA